MSLPKKGSRLIIINGISYRYKIVVRSAQTEIFIEQDEVKGQKLHCISRNQNQVTITPAVVNPIISSAIQKGWKPAEKGKTFSELFIEDFLNEKN